MLPVELGFNATGALNDSDARLVWELVANIQKPSEILKRHGLTVGDFKAKMNDGMFVAAYKEAKTAWKSELNVQQRIKLKAGLLVEDSLQDLFVIIKNPDMSAQHKIDAHKQLSALAGATGNKQAGGEGGSAFKLTINLGDKSTKSVTIDGHALPNTFPADNEV